MVTESNGNVVTGNVIIPFEPRPGRFATTAAATRERSPRNSGTWRSRGPR
jgi:hypothetical protein